MGKQDIYGPQLQKLCSVPQGRAMLELLPLCSAAKATILAKLPEMVGLGQLHRAGTRKRYRYFTHRAHRDAWEKQQQQQAATEAQAPQLDPRDHYTLPIQQACSKPCGYNLPGITQATGAPAGTLANKLLKLVDAGRLHRRGTIRKYIYFTHLHHAQAWDRGEAPAPAARQQPQAPRHSARPPKHGPALTIGSKAKASGQASVAEATTVTWPAHVKVQRAPVCRDTRFTFDPPPGWRGEFGREWQQKRRGRA